jgi:MFS transporter, FHS family, L-fucose permease
MTKIGNLFRDANGKNHALTFTLITTLFLLWGFCNGMIDILNKHFQNSLHINKMESALVQFANYMGYFFMAVPSGLLARRFGYKGGILIGLVLIALGAFWFIPATHIGTFSAFLLGLFVLASGLTFLETIANPYTTVLGSPEMSATRINLAQTCNAVGWILGPYVAGCFVFSSNAATPSNNDSVYMPYLIVGVAVTILIVLFSLAELPEIKVEDETAPGTTSSSGKPLFQRWNFMSAVLAQFLYVAAQTGIFSYFVNYVTSADMPTLSQGLASMLPTAWTAIGADGAYHVTDLGASRLLASGGFVLFLAGRASGSAALSIFKAHTTLALFALVNTIMMLLIVIPSGWFSVTALFLSFFFMSIMYPTIFALGIRGLGEHTKLGSSLIVMSIVGGAIMPLLMGWLADVFSMRIGFIVPLLCFIYITFYAAFWPTLEKIDTGHAVTD